ncbi:hypothetical protein PAPPERLAPAPP_02340 [Brevundimonas phage vB_BpoS-Papperlapapp]|uniref:Uncharacterized protein n=2 Tax=Marchewkavirus TaxID=3425052 RepID=A0A9E7MNX4_9CAUD|nr:hypothetical protein KABACHOK_00720 [Brevundimonas phage vB_BpoS-Kabachok]USN14605.1 hypothetical protein DOMOVOI_01310 [Brevundimonas phage vB_BpoS-Domovoi]USN15975.1 hypothetical protein PAPPERLAPAPP_02340 [Brevundimonas phage vB_BpoS-Papperlapapp]
MTPVYVTPQRCGDIAEVFIFKALQMDVRYRATNVYRRALPLLANDHDAPEERHAVAAILDYIADTIDRTAHEGAPHDTIYRRAAAMIRQDAA